MLRALQPIFRYRIHAKDGLIGHVDDFWFDDEQWAVRWMVVSTGRWLGGREVLVSPIAILRADWHERAVDVDLTREQVRRSPDVELDQPLSRAKEAAFHRHFGWAYYWGLGGLWGAHPLPSALSRLPPGEEMNVRGDPHLHSARDLPAFVVHATDRPVGPAEDCIVDDQSWKIRYLVVNAHKGWGKRVLVAPEWIRSVRWDRKRIELDATSHQVGHGPAYDPYQPVNRVYEEHLYDWYGRPAYWDEHAHE